MSRKRRGQALIEFALVIGVVVLLAVGAIQALFSFYLTRQVRAAAEEIADVAAAYGGDAEAVRAQIPIILEQHRLSESLAAVEIEPARAQYLSPFTVTLTYRASVRFYGLFELVIPPQRVRRLSEVG